MKIFHNLIMDINKKRGINEELEMLERYINKGYLASKSDGEKIRDIKKNLKILKEAIVEKKNKRDCLEIRNVVVKRIERMMNNGN